MSKMRMDASKSISLYLCDRGDHIFVVFFVVFDLANFVFLAIFLNFLCFFGDFWISSAIIFFDYLFYSSFFGPAFPLRPRIQVNFHLDFFFAFFGQQNAYFLCKLKKFPQRTRKISEVLSSRKCTSRGSS